VLVLAAPYIVTLLFQGSETSTDAEGTGQIMEKRLLPQEKKDGQEIDEEECLAGIVAEQIALDSQPEAIKAQAVIARTSLVCALENDEELPASMSREEMLSLWGQNGFEQNYRVLDEALAATQGEILVWKEKPIQAAFHAVSAGKTRDAKEALGVERPYLSSVDSSIDIPSHDFLKVIYMEKKDLADKLNQACKEAGLTEESVAQGISVTKRDSGDYALEVAVGAQSMTGEEFRECLDLNSACFSIKEVEGKMRIVTKGMGHGVGLSQYGANEMAKAGSGYEEILNYYYQDVTIEKYIE
jgi:stage II sporulation protein D